MSKGFAKKQNKYVIKGDIAYIFLENRKGEVVGKALIDREDLNKVLRRRWCRSKRSKYRNAVYASSSCPTAVDMHTFILGKQEGKVIDHINGNGLDNRKKNLEHVSRSANNRNQTPHKKSVGVRYIADTGRYRAYIMHHYHQINLGTYDTLEEAQAARNRAEHDLRYV